jgi:hypothetical protein
MPSGSWPRSPSDNPRWPTPEWHGHSKWSGSTHSASFPVWRRSSSPWPKSSPRSTSRRCWGNPAPSPKAYAIGSPCQPDGRAWASPTPVRSPTSVIAPRRRSAPHPLTPAASLARRRRVLRRRSEGRGQSAERRGGGSSLRPCRGRGCAPPPQGDQAEQRERRLADYVPVLYERYGTQLRRVPR